MARPEQNGQGIRPASAPNPLVMLVAGWLIPGLAHWMLGKRGKAILFLTLILGTFVLGMGMGNWRNVYYASGRWTALAQAPAGAAAIVGAWLREGPTDPVVEERSLFKLGTLYTAVAGLLNLVILIDALHAGRLQSQTIRKGRQ